MVIKKRQVKDKVPEFYAPCHTFDTDVFNNKRLVTVGYDHDGNVSEDPVSIDIEDLWITKKECRLVMLVTPTVAKDVRKGFVRVHVSGEKVGGKYGGCWRDVPENQIYGRAQIVPYLIQR